MAINNKPKFQLIHFLLFITVFSTLVSSTIHAQERIWKSGDHVEVQWKGDWCRAEVIDVKANQYKIHYENYASSWDERVDNSRIRIVGPKPSTPRVTGQATTASSAFDEVLGLLKQAREKQATGQIEEAISLADRALKSAEKDLGPEHAAVVISLGTLAQLFDQKKDHDRAEPLYLRALGVAEKANSGLEPFFVASLLNSLGHIYYLRSDFVRAEPLYQRALDIQEKALGPDHAQVATTLTNLGVMYQARVAYAALSGLDPLILLHQGRRSCVACPWLSYSAPLALWHRLPWSGGRLPAAMPPFQVSGAS